MSVENSMDISRKRHIGYGNNQKTPIKQQFGNHNLDDLNPMLFTTQQSKKGVTGVIERLSLVNDGQGK